MGDSTLKHHSPTTKYRPSSYTDANGKQTLFGYPSSDSLDRLGSITQPDNGVTNFSYADTPGNLATVAKTDQATDQLQVLGQETDYDSLGRVFHTAVSEGSLVAPLKGIVSDRNYDSRGRLKQISIPYDNLSGAGPSPWTTISYDGLSRPIQKTYPDACPPGDALIRQSRPFRPYFPNLSSHLPKTSFVSAPSHASIITVWPRSAALTHLSATGAHRSLKSSPPASAATPSHTPTSSTEIASKSFNTFNTLYFS